MFKPNTVFYDYHKLSGFIDQCNAEVLSYFPIIRQSRWKVKLLWQYIFSIFHNTRIFRNLSGHNYSSLEWRKRLCRLLSYKNKYAKEHQLQRFHLMD